MRAIKEQDWQNLAEQAQQEVYDFYLFIQQRYRKQAAQSIQDKSETMAFSNHSANLIEQWVNETEDEIWT